MWRLFLAFLFVGCYFHTCLGAAVHPHFSYAPSTQALVEGEPGRIRCNVAGNPTPPVPRWKRVTGKDVEISIRNSEKYKVLKSGGLDINNVEVKDAGKYVCFTSADGIWMDKEIHVKVIKASATPLAVPQSDYTVLYVFLGIIAAIIFFVLVDFSCFIFNSAGFINCFLVTRRERKKKQKTSGV